ncbi:hypothetical protein DTO021C3_6884 [Paecilomyces variotii]|nr:hypothetical protein DTO021C3_6884 [Paecilomyces variotii]
MNDLPAVMSGMSQRILGPQQILKVLTGSLGLSGLRGSEVLPLEDGYSSCPKPQLSCQTSYQGQDTCCFNYPGGQMLQTQFWDADPAIGPDDSWTIHGLWPDHCDGGFDQFCDHKRNYNNISLILVDAGRGDLLDYMKEYFKDYKGDDDSLYSHEFSKHGTCISTLNPNCYTDYYPQEEVVDYFNKTVEIFQRLPSYEFLEKANIVPSYDRTYSLADIEDALKEGHGADVTVRCHYQSLNEIWYNFNVAGRLQTGEFVPTSPDGPKSNCPKTGIHYKPKRSKPPSTTTSAPSDPTRSPSNGRGHLQVYTLNQKRGCIISKGTWFSSGTCATFRINRASDGFTLQSRKGHCAFYRDIFSCNNRVRNPTVFTTIDGKIAYNGNTTFFADKAPKGPTQSKIFASNDEHPIELSIKWQEV